MRYCLLLAVLLLQSLSVEAQKRVAAATPPRAAAPGAPTKRALIVAIGNYPAASGWTAISSVNDVALIQAALQHQGFARENIQVLTDGGATKAAIVDALQGLAAKVQPKDVVVFHYSGHGQQIADDNQDESDGLDEALVPYDAGKTYQAGVYEGQKHLRDDQLGGLLAAIRSRAGRGGEVLTVLDACHSGTGTRGLARARGTRDVFAPPGYQPPTERPECPGGCSFGVVAEGSGGTNGTTPDALAPLVCYFGASPAQLNFETTDAAGRGVGSLSLAFSRALTTSSAPTYAGLFDRIRADMAATAPNQTPQMEGPAEGSVFNGRTTALPTYYTTTTWPDARTVTITGGALHGLHLGTEVALYPPDIDTQSATPLATGKITFVEPAQATVALNKSVPGGPSRTAWAVVTKRTFGSMALRLKHELPAGALRDSVEAAIRRRPFITLVSGPETDLLLEVKQQTLTLISAQDRVLLTTPTADPERAAAAVVGAATALAQTTYLRGLRPRAEALEVQLTMVPVTVKANGPYKVVDQRLDPASKRDATGNLRYAVGDYMQLQVTNKGRKQAYFTILDIQPDNQLTVLVPKADEPAADYVLQPGQTLRLPHLFEIGPPYGTEMMKTIASDQPIDLRRVTSAGANRGASSREGEGNPFADLVAGTYQDTPNSAHRGSTTAALQPETVNVHDVEYQIVERTQP